MTVGRRRREPYQIWDILHSPDDSVDSYAAILFAMLRMRQASFNVLENNDIVV